MDIYCPICGEPWDMDELHYVAAAHGTTFQDELTNFQTKGCGTFDGEPCADVPDRTRAAAAAVAFELMGDDIDGVASFLEDLNYGGYLS